MIKKIRCPRLSEKLKISVDVVIRFDDELEKTRGIMCDNYYEGRCSLRDGADCTYQSWKPLKK